MSQEVFGIVNSHSVLSQSAKTETSNSVNTSSANEFSSEFEKYSAKTKQGVKKESSLSSDEPTDKTSKSLAESEVNNGNKLPDDLNTEGKTLDAESETEDFEQNVNSELDDDLISNVPTAFLDKIDQASSNKQLISKSTEMNKEVGLSKASVTSDTHEQTDETLSLNRNTTQVTGSERLLDHANEKDSELVAKVTSNSTTSGTELSTKQQETLTSLGTVSPNISSVEKQGVSVDRIKGSVGSSPVNLSENELGRQVDKEQSIHLDNEVSEVDKENNKPHILRSDISHAISSRSLASEKNNVVTNTTADKSSSTLAIKSELVTTEKVMLAQSQLVEVSDKPKVTQHSMAQLSDKSVSANLLASANTMSYTPKAEIPILDIQPSIQSAAWSRVMSARVVWMAREGLQQASIQLNPANLGPVEVKLHVNHEQANVTFIAQNAATRDAIEQAIPRLKENFNQNGMELNNADVSDQSFQQQHENNQDLAKNSELALSMHHSEDDTDSNIEQVVRVGELNENQGLSIYA